MFQVGDTVTYGTSGACRITAMENKRLGDRTLDCLILKPIYDSSLTISVPTSNELLMGKMHAVISRAEALELIHQMRQEPADYETDMNARKLYYNDTLRNGNHRQLVQMIKSIYQFKQARMANGKRLSSFDENAMREAENMLYTEFALALDIKPGEVVPFIRQQVEPQA
ncbi:MAG: CarD family transcriptional regulator [Gemmiger sp.]|nr:CarD family transcriptional regulator [Gemmiger sp.]